ncbi:hypothetical protein D3C72_1458210 [compost metagenome]
MQGAPGTGIARLPTQFIQMHAMFQQRPAVGRITPMYRWHIGGLQGVGQQLDRDTGIGAAGQVQQAGLARHEVGRDQDQFVLDAVHVRCQLVGHQ